MPNPKNKLKQKREAAKLSQWDLGGLTGFSQTWIWQMETSKVRGSDEARKKIADALGCKVSDIWE